METGDVFVAASVQLVIEKLASVGVSQFVVEGGVKQLKTDCFQEWEKMLRMIELQIYKTWLTIWRLRSVSTGDSRDVQRFHHLGGDLSSRIEEMSSRMQDIQTQTQASDLGLSDCIIFSVEVDGNTKKGMKWRQPHNCMKVCEFKGCKQGLAFPACVGNRFFKCMVRVILMDCVSCESLPPLGLLPSLKELRVERMDNIKKVGPEFYGQSLNPFPALTTLVFSHMSSWKKWLHPGYPASVDSNSMVAFPHLEQLSLSHCESLQGCLPPCLLSLKKISVSYCHQLSVTLTSLPLLENLSIITCKALQMSTASSIVCSESMDLPDVTEVTDFPLPNSCQTVFISDCHSLLKLHQIPATLTQLQIYNCDDIQSVELKKSSSATSNVQNIYISDCKSLTTLDIPEKISWLKIHNCESLKSLMINRIDKNLETPLKLAHLAVLRIAECPKLLSLPEDLILPAIKELMIEDNANFSGLPNQIQNFTSLKYLSIKKCPNIQSFPGEGLPRSLEELHIEYMNIKQPLEEWGLGLLDSLQDLRLRDTGFSSALVHCPKLESLGDESCLPPKLKTLLIMNCQEHVCEVGNKLLKKLNPYNESSFDSWADMPM
ncbi:putative disease resistance protein At3g14460 [Chenopodium quinoa]|uniref:putative disease resistance protein At3g14460 n=1 Tax=Chenopodium quinoa TaxID=63459 RepID=UPI000B79237B|nr:putative disease resistance protein At3g14460 [Chenopodium quinoa]